MLSSVCPDRSGRRGDDSQRPAHETGADIGGLGDALQDARIVPYVAPHCPSVQTGSYTQKTITFSSGNLLDLTGTPVGDCLLAGL
jgi:hypothetical protein